MFFLDGGEAAQKKRFLKLIETAQPLLNGDVARPSRLLDKHILPSRNRKHKCNSAKGLEKSLFSRMAARPPSGL